MVGTSARGKEEGGEETKKKNWTEKKNTRKKKRGKIGWLETGRKGVKGSLKTQMVGISAYEKEEGNKKEE